MLVGRLLARINLSCQIEYLAGNLIFGIAAGTVAGAMNNDNMPLWRNSIPLAMSTYASFVANSFLEIDTTNTLYALGSSVASYWLVASGKYIVQKFKQH